MTKKGGHSFRPSSSFFAYKHSMRFNDSIINEHLCFSHESEIFYKSVAIQLCDQILVVQNSIRIGYSIMISAFNNDRWHFRPPAIRQITRSSQTSICKQSSKLIQKCLCQSFPLGTIRLIRVIINFHAPACVRLSIGIGIHGDLNIRSPVIFFFFTFI